MRLFPKIFSILFVLYVLSILYLPSVKADCYFDAYTHCVGTCSCSIAGTCTCKLDSTGHVCQADTTYCCSGTCRPNYCAGGESSSGHCDSSGQLICCVTNTPKPQPTNTPQPTRPGASPTVTPPPQCTCNGSGCNGTECVYNFVDCNYSSCTSPNNAYYHVKCGSTDCGGVDGKFCGYSAQCSTPDCSLQNPKCEKRDVSLDCNYDAYGCNLCGVGRVAAIYCDFNGDGIKENHCGDLCVSNSLCNNNQWCSGGGGTNPTNTPTPTRAPTSTNTPTPTATPTPNPHWLKLKNTSFYTSRPLIQTIPASPVAVTTQPCHCEPPQAAKQSHVPQKQQEHSCDSRGDCFGGVSPWQGVGNLTLSRSLPYPSE